MECIFYDLYPKHNTTTSSPATASTIQASAQQWNNYITTHSSIHQGIGISGHPFGTMEMRR
jgi:hypothetical protein